MPDNKEDAEGDAAQAAIHDSIERARELIVEARQAIGKEQPSVPIPPTPAA